MWLSRTPGRRTSETSTSTRATTIPDSLVRGCSCLCRGAGMSDGFTGRRESGYRSGFDSVGGGPYSHVDVSGGENGSVAGKPSQCLSALDDCQISVRSGAGVGPAGRQSRSAKTPKPPSAASLVHVPSEVDEARGDCHYAK